MLTFDDAEILFWRCLSRLGGNTSSGMGACTSVDWACILLLHTEGNSSNSLVMPPRWPPMPNPQALQALWLFKALAELSKPIRVTVFRVYNTFLDPPPTMLIGSSWVIGFSANTGPGVDE